MTQEYWVGYRDMINMSIDRVHAPLLNSVVSTVSFALRNVNLDICVPKTLQIIFTFPNSLIDSSSHCLQFLYIDCNYLVIFQLGEI